MDETEHEVRKVFREALGVSGPMKPGNNPKVFAEPKRPTLDGVYPSFNDLLKAELPEREEIMTGVRRGEVAQMVSITNVGKSTFLLNSVVALLSGCEFSPLVSKGHKPVKVLYVDCESTASWLRHDLVVMKDKRPFESKQLSIWVDRTVKEEPLSLEKYTHLEELKQFVQKNKVDLVIIDTVSAAFNLRNENDNSEVKSRVMGPLAHLARSCNCAVIFAHHHGKPSESGGEKAYYGRGASAYGALSRTVYNLKREASKGENYVTLECAKIKGRKFDPTVFHLNEEARWFEPVGTAPKPEPKDVTVDDIAEYLSDAGGRAERKAIIERFSDVSPATIDRRLKEGMGMGILSAYRRGVYEVCHLVTPIGNDKVTKVELGSIEGVL
jgi:hypothetical protein